MTQYLCVEIKSTNIRTYTVYNFKL